MRRTPVRRCAIVALVTLVALAGCGPAHAATEQHTPPAPSAAPMASGAAATAPGASAASLASTEAGINPALAVVEPVPPRTTTAPTITADPDGPHCLICPAVQADPARPVVVHAAGKPAPVVSSVKTSDPVIFITIDDGEQWNEDAAQLLEWARVPVTLFLTETYIADKISSMRRLVDAGAWVEPHTTTHPNLLRGKNSDTEICGPLDRYETQFSRRGTLFRPPYGNQNTTTQNVAGACGMHAVVLWRASMNYGALATQGGELRAGDIVLMHFRPDLADNLVELFRIVNEKGLRVGRLECYVGGDPRCGEPWR